VKQTSFVLRTIQTLIEGDRQYYRFYGSGPAEQQSLWETFTSFGILCLKTHCLIYVNGPGPPGNEEKHLQRSFNPASFGNILSCALQMFHSPSTNYRENPNDQLG